MCNVYAARIAKVTPTSSRLGIHEQLVRIYYIAKSSRIAMGLMPKMLNCGKIIKNFRTNTARKSFEKIECIDAH